MRDSRVPVNGLQEIRAMRLDVEADEIGAQQAIHELSLPRDRCRTTPDSATECARRWRRARPAAAP